MSCALKRISVDTSHSVFDVVKGRAGKEIEAYLKALPGKEKVKVIGMDLSSAYRKLVRCYFPNAKIVADRFHVIRLINQLVLQTYQTLDPAMKYNRGLLAALRTNPERLSPTQQQKRNAYFKQQPAIAAIYQFKQQPLKSLVTLGKTLYQWREEIVRMWRFTKSNGITEGFHRKMKLIQRRAYGFKNFENYQLRVKVLCS